MICCVEPKFGAVSDGFLSSHICGPFVRATNEGKPANALPPTSTPPPTGPARSCAAPRGTTEPYLQLLDRLSINETFMPIGINETGNSAVVLKTLGTVFKLVCSVMKCSTSWQGLSSSNPASLWKCFKNNFSCQQAGSLGRSLVGSKPRRAPQGRSARRARVQHRWRTCRAPARRSILGSETISLLKYIWIFRVSSGHGTGHR